TYGNKIGDYRHLREKVVRLLKEGHLREFQRDQAKNDDGKSKNADAPVKTIALNHVINIIVGEVE
ncbi:hypothetical protein HAX54_050495, partial [Datura stramonium]|nr:hypothetical protein [Datura stramonium]